MARFLIAVWPFPSHYFPLVAIAGALRDRGHEVAFYSGERARPTLTDQGFTFFAFEKVDDEKVDALLFSRAEYASWRSPFRLRALLRDWLLGTVPAQVDDLSRVVRAWRPDVLLSETSMWSPMLVLQETERVPVAVFSTVAACLLPGPEAPLTGFGLPRPRSAATRVLSRAARTAVEILSRDFRREVNAVRRRYGLPALTVSVTEHTGRMPLYIVPTTREFDYGRRDLPPSVQYVGPCLWDQGADEPPPAWLAALKHDRPWVHVTEGTMHTQAPVLLRAAARGLGGRAMHVIMTTGGRRDPGQLGLGSLPANVRVEPWLSHRFLLPQTDVLVTTGGAGTVMSALEAGVPLVVVPTEWDKPENAQRVVEAGAGVRLAPGRLTPARLRTAVERVLGDPSFRRQARRLAAGFASCRGPARAAELLDGLTSEPRAEPEFAGAGILQAKESVS